MKDDSLFLCSSHTNRQVSSVIVSVVGKPELKGKSIVPTFAVCNGSNHSAEGDVICSRLR